MPSDRKPSLILPVTIAAVVMLALYVGSCFATGRVRGAEPLPPGA
jgi:hypothetical protein